MEDISREIAYVTKFSHSISLLLEENKLGSYLHDSHSQAFVANASHH